MFKYIRLFILKIFFGESTEQMMNVYNNYDNNYEVTEAHKNYMLSLQKAKERLDDDCKYLIKKIDDSIKNAVYFGETKAEVQFYSKDIRHKEVNIIKQLYKSKGYKVKVKIDYDWNYSKDRKFIVSWKRR